MADTATTVPIVNGATQTVSGYAVTGDANTYAAQVAVRANGAPVDDDNGLPTRPPPTSTVATTALTVGTSSVFVATAGSMSRGWLVQNTTTAGLGFIDLCWGATAVLGSGFVRLFAGASADWKGIVPPPNVAMTAIASGANQTMTITVFN